MLIKISEDLMIAEWTVAVWGAIGAAFIVGLFFGVLFTRFSSRNIQKQQQVEAELKNMKTQADEQKQQLEQHFAESATLLTTLAEDYKKLYSHLAQSSSQLLSSEKQAEVLKLLQHQDENQPRDYSEGSSGLFKNTSEN